VRKSDPDATPHEKEIENEKKKEEEYEHEKVLREGARGGVRVRVGVRKRI
jgi:hypothetical protein